MAKAKTELFERDLAAMAVLAKALSHPVRIQILKILAAKDVCICGEIVGLLPLAQSTVSQHLKDLKEAGFIKGEVEGPKTCYCLDKEALKRAVASFTLVFSSICRCEFKGDES